MANQIEWLLRVGKGIMRYSLVLFFVGFGLYKFTLVEALTIEPLMSNSPFFSWLYPLVGVQGASNVIGGLEITTGVLMALRRWRPLLSAAGSLMAAAALLFTLSFLLTTPRLTPDLQGFLIKDLTLLGAALWTAGEAFLAGSFRIIDEQPSLDEPDSMVVTT
ncbi:MAG: DUF417 family protein [Sphingorhabdus sp.]|uniref:DUF417 family protein n=1 Tax=Sphingorhabdus sp. TaxID=1902408 RepID=UPI0038FC4176